jgi:hypothetical protein
VDDRGQLGLVQIGVPRCVIVHMFDVIATAATSAKAAYKTPLATTVKGMVSTQRQLARVKSSRISASCR